MIAHRTVLGVSLFSVALVFGQAGLANAHTQSARHGQQGGCSTPWKTTDKESPGEVYGNAAFTNVRAGQHQCYDRLVIDLGDASRLTFGAFYQAPVMSGEQGPLSVRGGASLNVTFNTTWHNKAGQQVYRPKNALELVNVAGYRTFRQVAVVDSHKGMTTLALGVRAKLPFRILQHVDSHGSRKLIIDVAHAK